ncbi:MAG: hypothetical protein OJF62_000182 [Pseudolabrys sp.]|jgi:uncharacterized protein (DUF2336 family)|nr:hypothetical protein [Pseudolabrys sp.]
MIVRQFLQWIRNAPSGERADATSALARAYLHSDLSADDRAAAEGAMIMLLDDPSPLVRRALSTVFASSQAAPAVIVHALAADQPDVACPLLERSPLLRDADLVDLVASGNAEVQIAIASRFPLGRSVSAAIAEVGAAAACLAVLENPDAELATFSLDRIVERFGHLAAIRENLLARDDLPAATRQALLAKLSQTLAGFVAARQWLPQDHAEDTARQACEKATVTLAADVPADEVPALVSYLRSSGQLTAGLILRALLSGNTVLFEEALADLSGLPIDAVVNLIHDRTIAGFHALYRKAQLPDLAYPAFRAAVIALREGILATERCNGSQLNRRMVEHVLDRCAEDSHLTVSPLIALLQRYSVEAAREEARTFCQDLVAEPFEQPRLVA